MIVMLNVFFEITLNVELAYVKKSKSIDNFFIKINTINTKNSLITLKVILLNPSKK